MDDKISRLLEAALESSVSIQHRNPRLTPNELMEGRARDGYNYKKCGVILLDLMPAAGVQAGLFHLRDDGLSVAQMLHWTRFGEPGARSEFVSNRFTTNWQELLAV